MLRTGVLNPRIHSLLNRVRRTKTLVIAVYIITFASAVRLPLSQAGVPETREFSLRKYSFDIQPTQGGLFGPVRLLPLRSRVGRGGRS